MSVDRVRAYYESFDESGRLESPEGKLEFERTVEELDSLLPPSGAVLDLGGGPGRYAAHLASRGHSVTLVDLSPRQLSAAQARISKLGLQDRVDTLVGDARDLSFLGDLTFSFALALGPFYHLTSANDRLAAAREIYRVLEFGGTAVISFIPRMSGVAGIVERVLSHPSQISASVLRTVADRGVFENPEGIGFQSGYFPEVDELRETFEIAGFELTEALSLRGFLFRHERAYYALSEGQAAEVRSALRAASRRPELVSTGGHGLMVLRKRPDLSPD